MLNNYLIRVFFFFLPPFFLPSQIKDWSLLVRGLSPLLIIVCLLIEWGKSFIIKFCAVTEKMKLGWEQSWRNKNIWFSLPMKTKKLAAILSTDNTMTEHVQVFVFYRLSITKDFSSQLLFFFSPLANLFFLRKL